MTNFGVTIEQARDFILSVAREDSLLPDLYNLFLVAGISN